MRIYFMPDLFFSENVVSFQRSGYMVHFRLDFIVVASTMHLDQTSSLEAV